MDHLKPSSQPLLGFCLVDALEFDEVLAISVDEPNPSRFGGAASQTVKLEGFNHLSESRGLIELDFFC